MINEFINISIINVWTGLDCSISLFIQKPSPVCLRLNNYSNVENPERFWFPGIKTMMPLWAGLDYPTDMARCHANTLNGNRKALELR